ncbi:MAG: DMT family transporter [Bacteroidia bacterium]|nr:DMT family transporter [Bacteroidia bacterium]
MKYSSKFVGALMVFAGAIGSSSKAILAKLAYPYGVDPLSLLAIRMSMVFPVFLVIFFISKSPHQHKLTLIDYLKVIPFALMGYYLASFLDFYGLQFVPASVERLILFTYPTLVVLLSWGFLKKKINSRQGLALILAYSGILLVLFGDIQLPDKSLLWKGGFWIFLSALAYATYLIGSGEFIPRFGVIRFTAFVMCVASIGVFIHAMLGRPEGSISLLEYPKTVYYYIGLIGIFATIFPSFLISGGIARIGASNTAIIGSIGPVSTIVLAYIFLHERLSWVQVAGTLVVMTGVLLISVRKSSG